MDGIDATPREVTTSGSGKAFDPDRLEVVLVPGTRVLVCSDLHLAAEATDASTLATRELSERIAHWSGPGALVLNGDCFELSDQGASVGAVLDAHPGWGAALRSFGGGADRHVVVVAGAADARLLEPQEAEVLSSVLGAVVASSVDLLFGSVDGTSVVRVEHGHHFDPTFGNPSRLTRADRSSGPSRREGRSTVQSDGQWLTDPSDFSRYVGSRLVYREMLGRIGWLTVSLLVILLAVRAPVVAALIPGSHHRGNVLRWLAVGSIGLVVDAVALGVLTVIVVRRVFEAIASSPVGARPGHPNEPARVAGESLCAQGFAGFVTGHTHRPELMPLSAGFYANTGCGALVVEPRPARLHLPPVFDVRLRRSWIELEADRGSVRAELLLAETLAGGRSRLERLVVRRGPPPPAVPTAMASVPGTAGWPIAHAGLRRAPRRHRHRRLAAGLVLLAAVVNVLSALTPPDRGRLRALLDLLPVEITETASATLVFASVALLLLARGLRRGNRLAWASTVVVLVLTSVLHLTKGGDVEEAVLAAVIAIWIGAYASDFRVRPDVARVQRAVVLSVVGAGLAVGAAYLIVVFVGDHRSSDTSVRALAERLGGNRGIPLPGGTPFVAPALTAAGIGLAVVAALLVLGSRRPRRSSPEQHRADLVVARRIVAEHGGDTLAYFALRDDKEWFFTGSSMVAYAVRNGVCLVAPDPIGPPEEWSDTWSDFRAFADRHGWPVAVVGAHPAWLPIYEEAGMRKVYMGDEAIVNCQTFTLHGGDMKSLRGGYNRVRKAGYRTIFVDPTAIDADLAQGLRELMIQTRHGEVERGFSMTLSRIFDPEDVGLLLSVAIDEAGQPAAFCQWAPAADIDGWSLDLMRRSSDPSLPNGLTDFVVIDTIEHLKANHQIGLGLNFAVMRAVVAGERDGGFFTLERRILHKFSDTMQIESLWRYNEKYRPYWRPRYAVLDAVEHAAAHGVAIADAEGVSELPLIGRFLGRRPT